MLLLLLCCFLMTELFLKGEIDLLTTEIRRVENALQSTESPLHIARDCLTNRQRRIDTDLVQDDAEVQLLKVSSKAYKRFKLTTADFFQELETISEVRDTLTRTLEVARDQQKANREAKHQLEMDWSDKVKWKNKLLPYACSLLQFRRPL